MTAQSMRLLLPTLFFTALCSPAPKTTRVTNFIFRVQQLYRDNLVGHWTI